MRYNYSNFSQQIEVFMRLFTGISFISFSFPFVQVLQGFKLTPNILENILQSY